MDTPTWETGRSSNLQPVPRSNSIDTPNVDVESDLLLRGRRARVAIRCRNERRRASLELDQLLPRGRAESTPSTFLLTDAELRKEARRLFVQGWSVEDICAVLAVERVRVTT